MLSLMPETPRSRPLRLLCIGAHSDDLEIGCGGTLLRWVAETRALEVTWVVLSAAEVRRREALRSVRALLPRAATRVFLGAFRDGYFPAQYTEVKDFFEALKRQCDPDVVLTHGLEDRHQDHRITGELTWNTWRDHLVLEYEIPKYEGDLGRPNAYVPLPPAQARRKVAHLRRHFASQRARSWFNDDSFFGLLRLRGLECRAASGYAEAFHVRKFVL